MIKNKKDLSIKLQNLKENEEINNVNLTALEIKKVIKQLNFGNDNVNINYSYYLQLKRDIKGIENKKIYPTFWLKNNKIIWEW